MLETSLHRLQVSPMTKPQTYAYARHEVCLENILTVISRIVHRNVSLENCFLFLCATTLVQQFVCFSVVVFFPPPVCTCMSQSESV